MAGNRCSVCAHEARADVDAALVEGASLDSVAACTGLSHGALHRHAKAHLPPAIVRAAEVNAEIREVARAETLLDQVKDLQARALALLTQAECSGEVRDALAAIRECRGILELLGKVTREIDAPQVNVVAVQVTDETVAEIRRRMIG